MPVKEIEKHCLLYEWKKGVWDDCLVKKLKTKETYLSRDAGQLHYKTLHTHTQSRCTGYYR